MANCDLLTIVLLLVLWQHGTNCQNYGFQPPGPQFNFRKGSAPFQPPPPVVTANGPNFSGQSAFPSPAKVCESIKFIDPTAECEVPNALYPVKDSCKKYIRCFQFVKSGEMRLLELVCPAGQIFSVLLNKCENQRLLPYSYDDCPQLLCSGGNKAGIPNPSPKFPPVNPDELPFCPVTMEEFEFGQAKPCRPRLTNEYANKGGYEYVNFPGEKQPYPPKVPPTEYSTPKGVYPPTFGTESTTIVIPYVPTKNKPFEQPTTELENYNPPIEEEKHHHKTHHHHHQKTPGNGEKYTTEYIPVHSTTESNQDGELDEYPDDENQFPEAEASAAHRHRHRNASPSIAYSQINLVLSTVIVLVLKIYLHV